MAKSSTEIENCTALAAELGAVCDSYDEAPSKELQREIASLRDKLQRQLVDCHGSEDAALEDDRFDVVFGRASNILTPKKQEGTVIKRHSKSRRNKTGEDGRNVGIQYQ